MKYYLNIFKFNILYEQPVTIILRGINLIFLLIFKKKKIFFFKFSNFRIYFNFIPMDKYMGGRGIFLFRENLEPLLKFGHKLLKKNSYVIDAGANQGVFAISFAKYIGPGGRVLAFEPFTKYKNIIKKNQKLNNLHNISFFPFALSNVKKKTLIDYSHGIGSASITRNFGNKKKYINTVVLDQILDKGIKNLSLIKLDIEGAEYLALRGAEKTLKKYKPTIVVECFYKEFFQIKKILSKIGYESYKFSKNGNLIKIYRPGKFEANIIFLPS